MSKNRFEQVDEPQADAITLSLWKHDDQACGSVTVPAALSGGKLVNDVVSDRLPAVDAFRSAIRLANEMKAPIVVMDPEATWQPEWGALYRAD